MLITAEILFIVKYLLFCQAATDDKILARPGCIYISLYIVCGSAAVALLSDPREKRKSLTLTLQQPHLLLRFTAGHQHLEILLQLLTGADGLLVAGVVRELLQPGVSKVLRKMLAAPLVGRKEFLWGRDIFRLELMHV